MEFPLATIRIQFGPGFRFHDLGRQLPYLEKMGVDGIYASPIAKARPGSLHGYDIVDPTVVNPELGTIDEFKSLLSVCREKGFKWIQDIVPNHMAFHKDNAWLMDVLEFGQASPYSRHFDIDWSHPDPLAKMRLIVPFLGSSTPECFESGDCRLCFDSDGFGISYFEHRFPLNQAGYRYLFHFWEKKFPNRDRGLSKWWRDLGESMRGKEAAEQRQVFIENRKRLWNTASGNMALREEIRLFLKSGAEHLNEREGNEVARLLGIQHYSLSSWRLATRIINYRRFFNVNELISLRVEDPKVFEETHSLYFKLVKEGLIGGFRVDHVDGLFDPASYLARLRSRSGDIPIYVEKILQKGERLPGNWPVQGTTGYEVLNLMGALLRNRKGLSVLQEMKSSFEGSREEDFGEKTYLIKKRVVQMYFRGDVDNLLQLYRQDRKETDSLRKAVVALLCSFPAYRTYFSDRQGERPEDKHLFLEAIRKAKAREKELSSSLGQIEKDFKKNPTGKFFLRFQQLSGPVMAKGYEDTLFYRDPLLLSINEVGGGRAFFAERPVNFHQFMKKRTEESPFSMSATATHDTKRGEDARARLDVLSEIPLEWVRHAKLWRKFNKKLKVRFGRLLCPGPTEELLLYQALLGHFPEGQWEDGNRSFFRRLKDYFLKTLREGKTHTSWLSPNKRYEDAALGFLDSLTRTFPEGEFWRDFLNFFKRVAFHGALNSLSQLLLKVTLPGIPDFFQGTEIWDFSFVDPDNRRPVDFSKRTKTLEQLEQFPLTEQKGLPARLFSERANGMAKLWATTKALEARKSDPPLFLRGDYVPLKVTGEMGSHVFAFARVLDERWAVVIVPRLTTFITQDSRLPEGQKLWGQTKIILPTGAPENWRTILHKAELCSRGTIELAEALEAFPMEILFGISKPNPAGH